MKVKFKNGKRTYTMKVLEMYEDGSVKLLDGEILTPDRIIEYINE